MHRIDVDSVDGAILVIAFGELDAFAAPDLEAALTDTEARTGRVVVDLHGVSFLDSTALGVVVRALRSNRQSGGAAAVVLPTGSARRIFEITTLDKVLPVAPSREKALELLRAQAISPGG